MGALLYPDSFCARIQTSPTFTIKGYNRKIINLIAEK
ncbi:hypothetical protein BB2000_0939 [Proteus mirabilis BB2000]|nr:hypothetical protein BB2000_0939 [Proteus mirabilis BB2000]